jgi:hypothetical protein
MMKIKISWTTPTKKRNQAFLPRKVLMATYMKMVRVD